MDIFNDHPSLCSDPSYIDLAFENADLKKMLEVEQDKSDKLLARLDSMKSVYSELTTLRDEVASMRLKSEAMTREKDELHMRISNQAQMIMKLNSMAQQAAGLQEQLKVANRSRASKNATKKAQDEAAALRAQVHVLNTRIQEIEAKLVATSNLANESQKEVQYLRQLLEPMSPVVAERLVVTILDFEVAAKDAKKNNVPHTGLPASYADMIISAVFNPWLASSAFGSDVPETQRIDIARYVYPLLSCRLSEVKLPERIFRKAHLFFHSDKMLTSGQQISSISSSLNDIIKEKALPNLGKIVRKADVSTAPIMGQNQPQPQAA